MLESTIIDMINAQINKEFFSAYLYLAFANHFSKVGLVGFSSWYQIQAKEELDHAMIFIGYLNYENSPVVLETIDCPDFKAKDTKSILSDAYTHEKYITEQINKIYKKAESIEDLRTMNFLEWFIQEQDEEEHTAEDMLDRIKIYGEDLSAMYMMDKDLSKRKYEEPNICL